MSRFQFHTTDKTTRALAALNVPLETDADILDALRLVIANEASAAARYATAEQERYDRSGVTR